VDVGKILLAAGLGLAVLGLVVMLASKAGVELFRLPGDLVWRGRSTTVYFPIATSILLSVLLTLALGWWARK